MSPLTVSILLASMILSTAVAGAGERFLRMMPLPNGGAIVVAEGDFEPRSIGSYSLRVYGNRGAFPTDDFLYGIVNQRDGVVEAVELVDINGDRAKEIVVKVRSVGTGGYLSASAFSLREDGISEICKVDGLPKDADVVTQLTQQANRKPSAK